MIPKSLSASSALVYELCPARWKAEYLERAKQPSGSAANLGTACHAALEAWVRDGHHLRFPRGGGEDTMRSLFVEAYRALFADDERLEEGVELCLSWLERQDWTNRIVLSTETKLSFDLPTSAGPIPFNYIMDRFDLLEGPHCAEGLVEVEVVDYKSVFLPVQPEQLKTKIQARAYGLAAQMQYPDADRVWVTFDLLRYEPVGCVFTKEENRETYRYLKALAERIIADDEAPEVLNPDCRYCVRKFECESLLSHVQAGGPLGITDPGEAAAKRAKLASAKAALEGMISELDGVILTHCEREGLTEFETDEVEVRITARKNRVIDTAMLARVVPPEVLVDKGAKVNISTVDALLRGDELSDSEKSQVRRLIRTTFTNPSVSVKARA